MSYNIEKTNLAEGLLEQVDIKPRYPLGFRTRDAEGREYVYVKAIENLTAGVPVLGVARTGLTIVSGSVSDRCFKISAAEPSLATDNFNVNELKGTLIKITDSNSQVKGVYPITDASYDGVRYLVVCPEVKTGDTVAFANGAPVVAAGGASSTDGGAINCIPITDMAEGTYGFVVPDTASEAPASAGAHNVTRGRDLTSLYTIDELSAKVQAGDFSNIYVGDYITKKVKVGNNTERELDFVVAGIDYWYGIGDQGNGLETHHLLMVPDTGFYELAQMNGTNTTTGGYYGSAMHGIASPAYTAGTGGALTSVVADYETFLHTTLGANDGEYTFTHNGSKWQYDGADVGANLTSYGITYSGTPVSGDEIKLTFAKGNLEPYRQAIYTAFGDSHILTHRTYMTTSTSAGAWHNARVELMNECMVYGGKIFANNNEGERIAPTTLPYFAMNPQKRVARRGKGGSRSSAWLSSIGSGSNFCVVYYAGSAYYISASSSFAVRPYFLFA